MSAYILASIRCRRLMLGRDIGRKCGFVAPWCDLNLTLL